MSGIDDLRARFQQKERAPEAPKPAPPPDLPTRRVEVAPPSAREYSDKFYCEHGDCKCAKLYKVPSAYKAQHLKKTGEVWPYPAWKCPKCDEVKEQHCAEGLYQPYGFMSSCSVLCDY